MTTVCLLGAGSQQMQQRQHTFVGWPVQAAALARQEPVRLQPVPVTRHTRRCRVLETGQGCNHDAGHARTSAGALLFSIERLVWGRGLGAAVPHANRGPPVAHGRLCSLPHPPAASDAAYAGGSAGVLLAILRVVINVASVWVWQGSSWNWLTYTPRDLHGEALQEFTSERESDYYCYYYSFQQQCHHPQSAPHDTTQQRLYATELPRPPEASRAPRLAMAGLALLAAWLLAQKWKPPPVVGFRHRNSQHYNLVPRSTLCGNEGSPRDPRKAMSARV
jgi:hypothetical protein